MVHQKKCPKEIGNHDRRQRHEQKDPRQPPSFVFFIGVVRLPDRTLADLPRFAEFQAQDSFPLLTRPEIETPYIAPQTEIQLKITEIWQDILQLEKVGIDDNFFEVGGRSLAMIQIYSKLKELQRHEHYLDELENRMHNTQYSYH